MRISTRLYRILVEPCHVGSAVFSRFVSPIVGSSQSCMNMDPADEHITEEGWAAKVHNPKP